MAIRARLTAPREVRERWPWHEVETLSLPMSAMVAGDRRMEAENFLSPGFAVRHGITSKPTGWAPLSDLANVWQPSRLKGIQVAPDFGTPFLAATQVFDKLPVARKWLSLNRTSDYAQRYVSQGTILVTCSGTVGRATVADESISGILISHDLLRVEARDTANRGWIYGYLRSPTIRAVMTSAQYGHMIKHLETGHLEALPAIFPASPAQAQGANANFDKIVAARNRAKALVSQAEQTLVGLVGACDDELNVGEAGFSTSSASLFARRRRFDAACHAPAVGAIEKSLARNAARMESLRSIGCEIWLPNRFKRIPAEDGVELVDSSSIFEINPDFRRRISASGVSDRNDGRVERDWILMSRSGQTYGLLGSVVLATSQLDGKIITDDVIRIISGQSVHPGYLHLLLSHETLGRPRVKSLAYGSSIPHIEVEDLLEFNIPRFDARQEQLLGEMMVDAFAAWSEADQLENELGENADKAIREFIRGR